jgi:putative colanic acid biosynthesis glycosyltransferase
LKILQVNANYGFGSTGLIVKDIGEAIANSGNEGYFAYQRTNASVKNGIVVGNPLDWKLHAMLCRIFGGQGYYSQMATRRFLCDIKRIKPDVVHLHNLHSNYLSIDVLFQFLAKENIATVITMHDCWYFTGKCFHYVDCGCDRFITGCGKCPKRKAAPKSFFFDWSRSSLKNKKERLLQIPRLRVVGCSDWVCDEARKGILADCDIETVYNGVDISVFQPTDSTIRQEHNIGNDFLVMGMANKWLQSGNMDMLARVSSLRGVRLMIVGCTEVQIKRIADIDENIVAVGFIQSREELAKHYSAADVFVNLTHADTLPTVNMECICCGTPVITYNSCGSPELIDEATGMVVEENDKDGIIKALECIKSHSFPDCRQVGVKRFDKSSCYNRYIEIYKELAYGSLKD